MFQWPGDYPSFPEFEEDIKNDFLWVAVLNDEIVGTVAQTTLYQDDDYKRGGCDVEIPAVVPHRIAVHPKARGLGIGAQLMQLTEDLARDTYNFSVVRIDTHKDNRAMIHLIADKFKYQYMGEISLADKPGQVRNWYEKKI